MKISITPHTDPRKSEAITYPDAGPMEALAIAMLFANAQTLTEIQIADRSTITARTTHHAIRIRLDFPALNPANPLPRELTQADPAAPAQDGNSQNGTDASSDKTNSEPEEIPNPFQETKRNPWDKHRIKRLRMACRGYKRSGKTHVSMSQSEFAKRLGVTSKCVADWEAGRYQPVERYQKRLEMLAALIDKRRARAQ